MWHYRALHPGNYYLIQEEENSEVLLVFIPMATEKCVLVEYKCDHEPMLWFRKDDELFEVIEQLSEEHALAYENLFEDPSELGAAFEWDEDEWEDLDEKGEIWELSDDGEEEEEEEEDPSRLN
jgi:hypothetical protein